MKKICVVITNQTHYSRGQLVLSEIQKHPLFEIQIIVAGSALLGKYGNTLQYIENDGYKIDTKISMLIEGSSPISMAKTTGLGILEFSTAFENLRPDIVLIRGDRYEILAPAIAASYLNIPLAHIEGGDVTGTIDESVRHAVTKFSHIHFTTNELSRERVVKMGENPRHVHNVGSPDIESLSKQDFTFEQDALWNGSIKGVGPRLDLSNGFLLVIQHPVTTEYEESKKNAEVTLQAVTEIKYPAIWIWPNVDAGAEILSKAIRVYRETNNPKRLHLFRFLDTSMFNKVLHSASCIVGNSSAGIKESSYLGTPAVNIGTRQNGRLKGNNVMNVGNDPKQIERAILEQIDHGRYDSSDIYFKDGTAKNIANILATSKVDVQKKLMY